MCSPFRQPCRNAVKRACCVNGWQNSSMRNRGQQVVPCKSILYPLCQCLGYQPTRYHHLVRHKADVVSDSFSWVNAYWVTVSPSPDFPDKTPDKVGPFYRRVLLILSNCFWNTGVGVCLNFLANRGGYLRRCVLFAV